TLRSKSTDKQKIAFCFAFLDYLLGQPDLAFHGGVVRLKAWPQDDAGKIRIMAGLHKQLIDLAGVKSGSGRKIHLVNHDKLKLLVMADALKAQFGGTSEIVYNKIGDDTLLQFAQCFAG